MNTPGRPAAGPPAQRRDEAAAANVAARANAAAADAQYRKAMAGTRGETRAVSDAQAVAAEARNRAVNKDLFMG